MSIGVFILFDNTRKKYRQDDVNDLKVDEPDTVTIQHVTVPAHKNTIMSDYHPEINVIFYLLSVNGSRKHGIVRFVAPYKWLLLMLSESNLQYRFVIKFVSYGLAWRTIKMLKDILKLRFKFSLFAIYWINEHNKMVFLSQLNEIVDITKIFRKYMASNTNCCEYLEYLLISKIAWR